MNSRAHISRAELVGRLGHDPDLRYTEDQTPYARLSVATSDRFTDGGGVIRERTEWHNAVVWGPRAEEIAASFKKGDDVTLSGTMQVSSYAKDGAKNRVTEIHVDALEKNADKVPSRNESRIVGLVREDPKVRQLSNGRQLTTISIATRTDRSGEGVAPREREDWHNVALWGRAAEAAARDIKAGDTIAINGALRHNDIAGEDGRTRRVSAIDAQKFQVLERTQERAVSRARFPRPGKGLDRGI